MKGLEIARRFFEEWGLPYLRSEFPQISERAACLLCYGSQSLGNDDDLSRDHGWGPGFSIVLTDGDMRRLGERLHREINAATPQEWFGYKHRATGSSIEVDALSPWFRKCTMFSSPPKSAKSWGKVHEANLYMLRHASVFHDPLGKFSARQAAFKYYPRPIWLNRLKEETFNVWHYGQYNFLNRLVQRKDIVAISIGLGTFMQATMKLCMLLNEDFAPYWKWLPAEFRKQPNTSELSDWLSALAASQDLSEQVRLVESICKEVYSRLVAKNLVSENPTGHPHPLMCALMELGKLRS